MYFYQKKGLAMGSRPAPPLAILYVYFTVELEPQWNFLVYIMTLRHYLPNREYWDRYVDDVFSILEGNVDDVLLVINYINKSNPDNNVPYLHVSV